MSKKPELQREQALTARPLMTQILRREPLPGGGVRIIVPFNPVGYQRWLLRIPTDATREYELDNFGIEVVDLCNGERSVRHIVKRFAKDHNLNQHEAERAVTTFLQNMMRKGLVAMVIPK